MKKVLSLLTASAALAIFSTAFMPSLAANASSDQITQQSPAVSKNSVQPSVVTNGLTDTISLPNSSSQMIVTYTNSEKNNGTILYRGEEHHFSIVTTLHHQKLILDGKEVVDIDTTDSVLNPSVVQYKTISNGKASFTHNGIGYCYVETAKFTSSDYNHYRNLGTGLLGLLPYVGLPIALASVVQSIIDGPSKNLWYTVKTYCDTSYRYYAYKIYAYKNSGRTSLYTSKTKYIAMW